MKYDERQKISYGVDMCDNCSPPCPYIKDGPMVGSVKCRDCASNLRTSRGCHYVICAQVEV